MRFVYMWKTLICLAQECIFYKSTSGAKRRCTFATEDDMYRGCTKELFICTAQEDGLSLETGNCVLLCRRRSPDPPQSTTNINDLFVLEHDEGARKQTKQKKNTCALRVSTSCLCLPLLEYILSAWIDVGRRM